MFLGRLIPADTPLNDGGRPLHSKRSPSGVLLAAGHLNHGQIKRTGGGGGGSSGVMDLPGHSTEFV